MRIAVVTSQFPVAGDPTRGRPLVQTIKALARRVELKVFVPNARYPGRFFAPQSYKYQPVHAGEEQTEGFQVHYSNYWTLPWVGRLANGHAVARALRGPLRAFAPDLVLSYWLYPDAFGAARVAQSLHVPCVCGARGSDLRARDRVSLMWTRQALSRSAHLLTVSDDLRRIAIERFGIDDTRATTIANGCDVSIFGRGDRQAAQRALGLPAGGRLILYAGRLVAAKGLRELLKAWTQLARNDGMLRLAFVGDGALRPELARATAATGMGERVHIPGPCAPGQVAQWMHACDVFCLPSHTEGYPNVLVEALACGRPVVATPVGGILEIVDSGNGLLTPVGDSTKLARALNTALSRPWDEEALRRRFSRSWDDVAKETLAVCEAVVRNTALAS